VLAGGLRGALMFVAKLLHRQVDAERRYRYQPHEDQHQTEGKGEREDRELRVVSQAGRVPAVAEFRERSNTNHQKEQIRPDLKQPPHRLMIPEAPAASGRGFRLGAWNRAARVLWRLRGVGYTRTISCNLPLLFTRNGSKTRL
jgi:hypothetical protein